MSQEQEFAFAPMADHPSYRYPSDTNIALWRYTDLAKLVHLFATDTLHFSRLDKLGDPFEGSIPKKDAVASESYFRQVNLPESGIMMQRARRHLRVSSAASCWHMNERESAAMWKLYVSGAEGVCVRSTFARLRDSLPQRNPSKPVTGIFLGMVNYLDYEDGTLGEALSSLIGPPAHKRASFAHERELRATIFRPDSSTRTGADGKPESFMNVDSDGIPAGGISVPVDVKRLVEAVYVAPSSPTWFADVVRAIVDRFGYAFEVHHSQLDGEPLF